MKNYKKWHEEKTIIECNDISRVFFHEREVWWCSIGSNIGYEQDGGGEKFSRPVLVFKKFNNEVFWALPISTKMKSGKFYEQIFLDDKINRIAILSQLRMIDAKRLTGKIGIISLGNYIAIQKAVTNLCVL